jgi:ankyrin repeat protein
MTCLVYLLQLTLLTACVATTEVNNHRLLNAINSNIDISLKEVLAETSRKQLNKKGQGGQTPLMFAAMSGKEKAVSLLLEAGAILAYE